MCCYFYVSDHVYCVVRHWAVLICQKKMYVHNRTRKITSFHLNTIERGMESLLSLLQKYKEILLQHYLKIFCLFNINKVFLAISKKNSLCLFLLTQEFRESNSCCNASMVKIAKHIHFNFWSHGDYDYHHQSSVRQSFIVSE